MGSSHTPQPTKSLNAAEGAVKFQGSHEFFMQCHKGESWRKALSHFCLSVVFFFNASKNWALSTFCLCNVAYVSLSFKCMPQTMESWQEMDEMRWWNRNQSHSGLPMMEEVTARGLTGTKIQTYTWHENMAKICPMKKKLSHLKIYFQSFPY